MQNGKQKAYRTTTPPTICCICLFVICPNSIKIQNPAVRRTILTISNPEPCRPMPCIPMHTAYDAAWKIGVICYICDICVAHDTIEYSMQICITLYSRGALPFHVLCTGIIIVQQNQYHPCMNGRDADRFNCSCR